MTKEEKTVSNVRTSLFHHNQWIKQAKEQIAEKRETIETLEAQIVLWKCEKEALERFLEQCPQCGDH